MIYRIYGDGKLVDMAVNVDDLYRKLTEYENNPYIRDIKVTEAEHGCALERRARKFEVNTISDTLCRGIKTSNTFYDLDGARNLFFELSAKEPTEFVEVDDDGYVIKVIAINY